MTAIILCQQFFLNKKAADSTSFPLTRSRQWCKMFTWLSKLSLFGTVKKLLRLQVPIWIFLNIRDQSRNRHHTFTWNQSCIADQSLSWVRRSDQFIAMIWEKSSDQSSCQNLNLSIDLKLTSDHWGHLAQWTYVILR